MSALVLEYHCHQVIHLLAGGPGIYTVRYTREPYQITKKHGWKTKGSDALKNITCDLVLLQIISCNTAKLEQTLRSFCWPLAEGANMTISSAYSR